MVRWVVGSILHGVDPLSYFSTTGLTKVVICAILSGMVGHIKEPLLLIRKSIPCGSSRFPHYLSGPLSYV